MSRDLDAAREMDEIYETDEATLIAFRKFINELAGTADATDVGVMEATYRALDTVDTLRAENRELRERVEKTERVADTALQIANKEAESDDSITKKRHALLKSRNELVRRAAIDVSESAGSGVSVSDVQDMAKPEVTLYRQTVSDAWNDLVRNWDCFCVGTGDSGTQRLLVEKSDISAELVHVVEHDLGREDLAKRLGVER